MEDTQLLKGCVLSIIARGKPMDMRLSRCSEMRDSVIIRKEPFTRFSHGLSRRNISPVKSEITSRAYTEKLFDY